MRTLLLSAIAAATLLATPVPVMSQTLEFGPGGFRYGEPRRRGPDCEELRYDCETRRGEGNCRRYREVCGAPPPRVSCRELREECEYGERGRGACRRYRETCGG